MKKEYISPMAEMVSVRIDTIMTDASLLYGKDKDGKIDSKYQGADELRSDWENIWEGM